MSARAAFTRTEFKPAILPAVIALGVVIAGAVFAEQQNNRVYRQQMQAEVLNEIAVIRSRLEGNINTNIQLARGLASAIATEPDMRQQRFTSLARHLFSSGNQLRNIAAAPDMVITMMYPLAGNEQAIGLDYSRIPAQRDAALRARDTGQLVLAGPVDLVQGGRGFVGRLPVYVDSGRDSRFWGVVAAVIDVDELYSASGLDSAAGRFDIALRGADGLGAAGEQFFGPPGLFGEDVVVADVFLPHGTWQIAARPKGGWPVSPPNRWTIRGLAILAAGLVVMPIFAAGWLLGERHDNLRRLKSSQAELERVSGRLELALEASQIGVWENDVTGGSLFWDSRIRTLFGIGHDAPVTHEDWTRRLHPEDSARAERDLEHALLHRTPYNSEFRIVRDDGEIRTIRSRARVIEGANGALRIVGIHSDITADVRLNEDLRRARLLAEARNAELEAAKARIEHNALHDSLTGLPNRRYLDDILAGKGGMRLDPDSPHGVLHIDLDRFKQINDTLGHAAGDAMLIHAAKILGESVRGTDFVARIGGDEFVILCPRDAGPDFLENLAGELVDRMRQPAAYQGRECRFGVSIGIACGQPGLDPRQLLINADIALYRAKAEGRGRHHVFSDDLHMAAVMTKKLADEIMTGIERDQFVAYYQGQFDARTRAICGAEALIRWKHPQKGLLAPGHFLPVAEELNVTAELDRIVLEQALRQMRLWRKAGLGIPRVSVNVSARRLNDKTLIAGLKDLNIEPGTVTFELVESIFLDDGSELVAWNIDQIKELGIGIEIDDFGTGYTSILSLMRLRPERLKIDRQLVYPITESPAQRDLVRSIVRIGASLGIEAIAEGVESMAHADILCGIGCTGLQGYVFARPMSGRAFTRFAKAYAPGGTRAA